MSRNFAYYQVTEPELLKLLKDLSVDKQPAHVTISVVLYPWTTEDDREHGARYKVGLTSEHHALLSVRNEFGWLLGKRLGGITLGCPSLPPR